MSISRRKVAWFVLGAGLAGVLLVVFAAVFTSATKTTQIRDTQETNSPLIASTNRTLKIIRDCTTPGRECYERGQQQLKGAITDINRVSIIAAACASGPREVSVTEIQACVIRRLSAQSGPH